MFSRLFIFAVCVAVPSVWAYSSGAPPKACVEMAPHHNVSMKDKTPIPPQTSAAPYKLVLSKKSVKAGETVKVEVRGKGAADLFEGFLVQARVDDKPVGQFKAAADSILAKAFDCGALNNTITHQRLKDALHHVKFTWTAPSSPASVKFVATVAKNHDVFWVKKVSASLKVV